MAELHFNRGLYKVFKVASKKVKLLFSGGGGGGGGERGGGRANNLADNPVG